MADKKKASMTSRIASICGLLYILSIFLMIGAAIAGASVSPAIGVIVFVLSFICLPIFGLTGIILGIVALCTLTPEEKQEKMLTSGTTKNQALVGIIVPPIMTAILVLFNLCLYSVLA